MLAFAFHGKSGLRNDRKLPTLKRAAGNAI